MQKSFIALTAVSTLAAVLSIFASDAYAMTGHEAAVACERRGPPGCMVSYHPDGSIDITTGDGHYVYCLTPRSQCVLGWRKSLGKPNIILDPSQIEALIKRK